MSLFKNDTLHKALKRQPQTRTPVWLMRQAGRYLPEYRRIRAHAGSFMDLCKNPSLACEVTLQPLARFDLDAAIVFSDILTIPDAMGYTVTFEENEGPKLPPVQVQDVEGLSHIDPNHSLTYVLETIDRVCARLHGRVPLIGFSGSPWTLATYMIEGGSSRHFIESKRWLYQSPAALHTLLDTLSTNIAVYLRAQILAGANPVMLFDTWGGILSTAAYREFSLPYMQKIIDFLRRDPACQDIPIILFTKGGAGWLELQAETGANALGLDWTADLQSAFERVGKQVALQGNLDPAMLLTSKEAIVRETEAILKISKMHPGFIFNLGHGILPESNPEHVSALIETIRSVAE